MYDQQVTNSLISTLDQNQSIIQKGKSDQSVIQIQKSQLQNAQQEKMLIQQLKQILQEEQEVLKNVTEIGLFYQKTSQLSNIMEAFMKELLIRNQTKLKILNFLCTSHSQNEEYLQSIQELSQKYINQTEQLKILHNFKNTRHAGLFKIKNKITSDQKTVENYDSVYDWVVDIDLLTQITQEGWEIEFNQISYEKSEKFINRYIRSDNDLTCTPTQEDFWEGAVVAVVGLFDKGKTFVLNNLTNCNLPSGKKVNTKGLSFKNVVVDYGTKLILLDTAGSYSPVRISSEFSVIEKEACELFILDLVFEISDYFICVVNDFTSLDQRYLDKITRNLQNSTSKTFREVIVIHNLKEVENKSVLDYIWENQVTLIYGQGNKMKTLVAAVDRNTNKLTERHVVWFKTHYSRHICLVNDDSKFGYEINPWTFSLLRYWLKAVFVPVNRKLGIIDNVMNHSSLKLSRYFKVPIQLYMENTDNKFKKLIKTTANLPTGLRLNQVSIDTNTGFITTRPDSFLPPVDIIKDEKFYNIIMEVPGLNQNDISLQRQNVITIVKGTKLKPYQITDKQISEKLERKYGEFTMTFKIPDTYERKWIECEVVDGVLKICYPKDQDDIVYNKEDKKNDKSQIDEKLTKEIDEVDKEFDQDDVKIKSDNIKPLT